MAGSQFPVVLAALVASAETALAAEDVRVTYGIDITEDTSDFLMFGVDDPTSQSPAIGSWSQEMATMATSRPRDETGTINCAAASANGDPDGLQTALEAAHGYVAAVEAFLRADPSLGLGGVPVAVVQIGGSGTPFLSQDEYGASAVVVFTVTYKIRI